MLKFFQIEYTQDAAGNFSKKENQRPGFQLPQTINEIFEELQSVFRKAPSIYVVPVSGVNFPLVLSVEKDGMFGYFVYEALLD